MRLYKHSKTQLIKLRYMKSMKLSRITIVTSYCITVKYIIIYQRWSRGHKARGQGQGQPFRGQTLSRPRTEMLEAKAKDQGHKRKCSPKKKKVFTKIFQAISTKKRFPKNFSSTPQNFNKKIVLSSSRGQANFRGLEASRPRP